MDFLPEIQGVPTLSAIPDAVYNSSVAPTLTPQAPYGQAMTST